MSRFTNKNVIFEPNNIKILGTDAAKYITRILGKDVSEFSVVQSDNYGNITLLSGRTKTGKSYSEFHFGAGESSIEL